jgi:Ca-activated chloride channel family protein
MKKNLSFFVFFFLFLSLLHAQNGTLDYQLTVLNTKLSPLSGLAIIVQESSTNQKLKFTSDSRGMVAFKLDTGKIWWLSVGKMYKYESLEVPERGITKSSATVTYDLKNWERENRPMPDRSKINFEIIKANTKENLQPTAKMSVAEVIVKRKNGAGLPDFSLTLTCIKEKKQYLGKTDKIGKARFLVPINNDYEIDIDGIESYTYIDISKNPGFQSVRFTYEPTNISEKDLHDTITQTLPANIGSTSARVVYTIGVRNQTGEFLKNETVYLNLINSDKVYQARTNDEGEVKFLLPIQKKYMLNFEFQRDVDVINLTHVKGIGQGSMNLIYNPDPKLQYPEQFIPTSEALIISDFNYLLKKQTQNPKNGNSFGIIAEWGNGLINEKSKEAVLTIGFWAVDTVSESYGPPVNIAFVMDKSGSMEGDDRIGALKKSLLEFVKHLRNDDVVSLVTFNGDPELSVGAGTMASNRAEMNETIQNTEAGGMTNIYKALILGSEQILKNKNSNSINRVILLSDGYCEVEPKITIDKTKEYHEKGVDFSTIGVGQDYNQALLTLIATEGGGDFQHVGEAYNLEKSFENEWSNILYPLASDVKVEIEYNNMLTFSQLYGFDFKKGSGNQLNISIKNIYPAYNKLAIIKFDLNKPNKSIENQEIIVRISYFDYKLKKQVLLEEISFLKWDESGIYQQTVLDKDKKTLYAVAIMNQSLKVMADAFEVNDFVKAENAVNRAIEQINELFPDAKQADVQKLYESLKSYSKILKQYRLNKIKKKLN